MSRKKVWGKSAGRTGLEDSGDGGKRRENSGKGENDSLEDPAQISREIREGDGSRDGRHGAVRASSGTAVTAPAARDGRGQDHGVEAALAEALRLAATAERWEVVSQLAAELAARRAAGGQDDADAGHGCHGHVPQEPDADE